MNIIFLWDSNLNYNDTGIMLSGKYFITYERTTRKLCVKRNDHYVDGFWGRQIRDCFAIVGDNGAGKTVLANCIMEHIGAIKTSTKPDRDFLTIGEDEKNGTLLIFHTIGLIGIKIPERDGIRYQLCPLGNIRAPYLKEFEVAYFHNVLSRYDYFVRSRCRYDFALGVMMSQHRKKTYEMHYDRLEKDVVSNYYNQELFRIITFLYDDKFLNKLSIKFPRPKWIYIRIADERFNEDYIMEETKKLIEYKKGDMSEDDINRFRNNVDKITKICKETWVSYTVKNLILNCYKELCIPQSVPSHDMVSPQVFFNACAFLEHIEPDEFNLYECAFDITKNLLHNLMDEIDRRRIICVEKFIHWLRRNGMVIHKSESELLRQLNIQVNQDTEIFMMELISLYSEMNFEFPFYDFAFDVSAGEFDFLTFFSNLYSMVSENNSKFNVYDYPKLEEETRSVLLIFDEADISMHPKWQRMYMKWMMDFCEQTFGNRYIKIIVTTHSPILLSDFPSDSILYLERDKETAGKVFYRQKEKKTFGSNVHSLYLDSFFLEEGTMGAFAEQKINEIAGILLQKSENMLDIDYEKMSKMIDYIGEGIINEKLQEVLNRDIGGKAAMVSDEEKTVISDTLMKLREQRNYMDRLIKELEDKISDKSRY